MNPREVFARKARVRDGRAAAVDEVDDARRKPRSLEKLHDVMGRKRLAFCWLPHDRVAHERWRRGQVSRDGGEVERRHREDEALKATLLRHVSHARRRDGLVLAHARRKRHVEAKKVDELTRGIDLRLVRRLALTKHRRGVERCAPRAGEEIGRTQKDASALFERHARPVVMRLFRRTNRLNGHRRATVMKVPAHTRMRMGFSHRDALAYLPLDAANHVRKLEHLRALIVERALERITLGATRRVVENRFVHGQRERLRKVGEHGGAL